MTTNQPFPDNVCLHCGEPVNRFTKLDGSDERYQHGNPDKDYGHEVTPIPRSEALHVNYMCDFCSSDTDVNWIYPTGTPISTTTAVATPGETVETPVGRRHYNIAIGKKEHDITHVHTRQDGEPIPFAHHNFSVNWTACDACSRMIETGDIERLVTHVRRQQPEWANLSRRLLREHFAEFWKQRQPRQPITAAQ